MSTAGMKKVTCPIFDGHDYPKWKAMMRKRLMAMNNELWTVIEIGLTDLCKMADTDDIRKYQVIHNQVIPEVHQNGVSSCALHQYDLNGSAKNKLHYHYQLCIFWLQYYEHVYCYLLSTALVFP